MYVVFLHGCRVCWCLGVGLTSLLASPNFHFEVRMEFVAGCKGGVLWVWICAHVHGCLCLWTKQVPACIALFSLYSMYLFPHRLVSSPPICPVEQYHLSIRLLHSYNQYVGLGSVCVLHVCMSGCVGGWVWVCGCGCLCLEEFDWAASTTGAPVQDSKWMVCVYVCVCVYQ